MIARASILGATLAIAHPAFAQTWASGKKTPTLKQIFAIDQTGEAGWPYGQEDVAGDGLNNFKQPEQSIDIRTAYAAADTARFWARVYVSDPNAVGGNVTVYFFIDADQNTTTGGTAKAPEIDAKFTTDTTPGGYEYVVGVRGNQTIAGVWSWSATQAKFVLTTTATQATAEGGTDVDPILLNSPTHGYLQASVPLMVIGLTSACTANLYVRSTDLTGGDLEVGQVGSCVPADANNDGVPDVLVPSAQCTSNAQCAGGGVCKADGTCVLPVPCTTSTDCLPTEQCTTDGRCVPKPTGSCTSTSQCGDLVCTAGQCTACTLGSTECGPNAECGPDGRCVIGGGTGLPPGDEVRGGAFKCAVPAARPGGAAFDADYWRSTIALFSVLAAAAIRRRRRRQ